MARNGNGMALTTLPTAYGPVRGYVHEAPGAEAGAVMVGGVGNDVDGPGGSYVRLAEALREDGCTTVRVSYARTGDLMRSVDDVLGALDWLAQHGVGRSVLVGWSFGGAVVIAAGAGHGGVAGVATLATQGYDTAQIQSVAPRSLLLVHGTADSVLSWSISQSLHRVARPPKRLELLDGAGHDIAGHEDRFESLVLEWAVPLLGIPPVRRAPTW